MQVGSADIVRRGAVRAPALNRREQNKQDKLQRILGAAHALFRAKDFAAVTTQEIAQAADIAAGTLFLYVTSKEDLLVLVFKDEMVAVARKAFAGVDRGLPLAGQLLLCFNSMKSYHARDLALSRVLLKELTVLSNTARRADIAALMRVIHGGLTQLLLTAQQAGTLAATLDVRTAAQTLFAGYYLGLIGWLGGAHSAAQYERHLRRQIDLILGGAHRVTVVPKAKRRSAAIDAAPRARKTVRS